MGNPHRTTHSLEWGAVSRLLLILGGGAGLVLLLIGIIVPQVIRQRHSARCMENLVRIGQAVQMYTEEFDGALPYEDDDLRDGTKVTPWTKALLLYMNDREHSQIAYCPAARAEKESQLKESYRFNSKLQSEDNPKYTWRKMKTLREPSKTPLIFDGKVGGKGISIKGDSKDMAFRHGDRCNVLFADFNVQSVVKPDKNWMIFEDDLSRPLR